MGAIDVVMDDDELIAALAHWLRTLGCACKHAPEAQSSRRRAWERVGMGFPADALDLPRVYLLVYS